MERLPWRATRLAPSTDAAVHKLGSPCLEFLQEVRNSFNFVKYRSARCPVAGPEGNISRGDALGEPFSLISEPALSGPNESWFLASRWPPHWLCNQSSKSGFVLLECS
jgi:hypothetical protein